MIWHFWYQASPSGFYLGTSPALLTIFLTALFIYFVSLFIFCFAVFVVECNQVDFISIYLFLLMFLNLGIYGLYCCE